LFTGVPVSVPVAEEKEESKGKYEVEEERSGDEAKTVVEVERVKILSGTW
jgi:hypothetical protein